MFGWFKRKKKDADSGGRPKDARPRAPITFEDDGVTVEAPLGARLPDICDDEGLSLGFGCREGGCGTCLILVTEGMSSLSAPSESEQEMLSIMAEGADNARLACQCVVSGAFTFRSFDQ